jgi:hypothetical protein
VRTDFFLIRKSLVTGVPGGWLIFANRIFVGAAKKTTLWVIYIPDSGSIEALFRIPGRFPPCRSKAPSFLWETSRGHSFFISFKIDLFHFLAPNAQPLPATRAFKLAFSNRYVKGTGSCDWKLRPSVKKRCMMDFYLPPAVY